MIRSAAWACGLGGSPLKGSKIVRLVYLDEAGISDRRQEPHLVVAGVIVDADRKWKELETYFRNLAVACFPDGAVDPHRFVFHAKDIWHGNGRFDRKKWPRPQRLRLLSQLAQVPRLFELPIVMGAIDRASVLEEIAARKLEVSAKGARQLTHAQAFLVAIQGVENWMQRKTIDEVAMLIAEDTDKMRDTIDRFHEGYTDPDLEGDDAFRSRHIIDCVHFAKKQKSVLLQIADHCAFIIKRKLMNRADIEPFFAALSGQIHTDYVPAKSYALRVKLDEIAPITDAA
jgi:Protein of unknown function (DUF3800)